MAKKRAFPPAYEFWKMMSRLHKNANFTLRKIHLYRQNKASTQDLSPENTKDTDKSDT